MKNQKVKKAREGYSGWSKKLLWPVLSLLIALASIGAVASQLKQESLGEIWARLREANPVFLAAAVAAMLGFILFEALALRATCAAFAPKPKIKDSCEWAAADIYFSAITPSATGGQPACLLLMCQNGISGMSGTAALVLNLTMYTVSILVIGLGCFLIRPQLFWQFGTLSRVLIAVGYLVQIGMALFFYLLLRHEKLLGTLCGGVVRLGGRIRLIRHPDAVLEKLNEKIEQYRTVSGQLAGHRKTLLRVFGYNLLQRLSQIAVTMFVFLAMGIGGASAVDLLAMQSYVVLGSNYVPVPGGMGVTDFLMLDGFGAIMDGAAAVRLELVSRSLSFYLCILLCGGALVLRWVLSKKQKVRKSK